MSKVYTSIDQLIGHTPLLELTHFEADEDLKARVLVKLEYFNPAGSVKDRVAKNMIDEAEKAGKLVRGGDYTIIEPTSGNTGVGIASVAAARGYKVIITMPETMSVERRKLMQAYGAQLVLTDGSKGMKGAIAKAEELQKETPNSIIAGQFVNPANPAIHKATTGPEIWDDTDGRVDIFVAGGIRVGAKYRYRQKDQAATLTRGEDGQMLLTFDEPQRAIAPGQAVVVYRGDIVLGGGTVTAAIK